MHRQGPFSKNKPILIANTYYPYTNWLDFQATTIKIGAPRKLCFSVGSLPEQHFYTINNR